MIRRISRDNITSLMAGLVLVAAAGLYIFTLDNGLRPDELTGGDLITHQYAQVEARPSKRAGVSIVYDGGVAMGSNRAFASWPIVEPNPNIVPILHTLGAGFTADVIAYFEANQLASVVFRGPVDRFLRHNLLFLVLQRHHRAIYQRGVPNLAPDLASLQMGERPRRLDPALDGFR